MSFSERITEFSALVELFIKRQGRIRNIVTIIFYDVIYPLGLYFSLSKLVNSQDFYLFLSGLLVLFTTTYVISSVTAWLGMDKAYNYYPIIRSLGPSIIEYSLVLITVVVLTTMPGVIMITLFSSTHFLTILLILLVISIFPPIFYPASLLPSPWGTILSYIYTADTANVIKALLEGNLSLFLQYYYALVVYLLVLIMVFLVYLNKRN
jgi:hypothetical protein